MSRLNGLKSLVLLLLSALLASCGGGGGSAAPNVPPQAQAGSDQTVVAGTVVSLMGGASSDSDGRVSSYLWQQLSGDSVELDAGATATASFDSTVIATDQTLQFQLTVTDNDGASAADTVAVEVNAALPVADAGVDQSIGERRSVFIGGTGSRDAGGAITHYRWLQRSGPAVTLTGADSSQARFTAPSVDGQAQSPVELTFELTVSDEFGETASDAVQVSVTNTLIAPLADAGDNKTLDTTGAEASPLIATLIGGGSSDPDGEIVSYAWQQSGSPIAGIALSNSDQVNATVTISTEQAEDRELFFALTVTDNEGQSDTDTVKVTALAPISTSAQYRISGSIVVAAASQLDSDVNDITTDPFANGSLSSAQLMPSPAIVGGYVNIDGEGTDGNSFDAGDVFDNYRVTLMAGQSVLLLIGNRDDADLDLWLYSLEGDVVDSSLSYSSNESVVAPADGEYFVEVEAWSGFSNYNLAIGLNQSLASNGYRLSDTFVDGQLIAASSPASVSKMAASTSYLGLDKLRGDAGRAQLYQLASGAAATARSAAPATQRSALSAAQRSKYATLLAVKQLHSTAAVDYAHPNYLLRAQAVPNDPRYNQQWHYPLIDLDLAWDITVDSHPSGAKVAVIDTGSLPLHPDLDGQFVGGYDFISSAGSSGDGDGIDSDPSDPGDGGGSPSSFHGTHVAGTVAAASNNGIGVTGVAWKTATKVMPLRVLGEFGGSTYDVVQAIRYAGGLSNDSGSTIAPVDVINLSLGGSGACSSSEQQAFDEVRSAGVLVAVAAGNDSADAADFSPANCEGVYTVSAVDASRSLAWYSNYGDTIELAAPGGDTSRDSDGDGYPDGVLSTLADDSGSALDYEYTFYQGTSMATPHMAGVLALMKSVNPLLTPVHIDVLLASGDLTEDIGAAGRDDQFGWGLINARKAVSAARDTGGDPPPPLLSVSPRQVNFGTSYTQAILTARNAGGDELEVTEVLSSQSWLTIVPSVDDNGLGSYALYAERDGLEPGSYTATVTFNSSAGQSEVAVSLLVVDSDFEPKVGPIYVLLVNNDTEEVVAEQRVTALLGQYQYSFSDIAEGNYRILAGSDFDNDFYICDAGEACGRYQTRSNPTIIELQGGDLADIDFTVEYEVSIAAEAAAANRQPAARQKPTGATAGVARDEG